MYSAPSPAGPKRPFWSRHLRREIQFALDLTWLGVAFALAYLLRFEFRIPAAQLSQALVQLPLVVLVQFSTTVLVGIYSYVWRYVGLAETQSFLRAAAYSTAPLLVLRFGLPPSIEQWKVPVSVILIDALLAFGGLLGLRVLRRSLYERFERVRRQDQRSDRQHKSVLLVGAGRAGVLAAREVMGRGDLDIKPLGFVDDDESKLGSVIQGLRVLGTTQDIPHLAAELKLERVIITIAEAGAERLRRIFDTCQRAGVRVQIIPGLFEILQGKISFSRFRDIQIEDLLGREPVDLDEEIVQGLITGRRVMVTGAGGSIGSELARQIARFRPGRLLLVERSEGALFEIERQIRELWPLLDVSARLADVGDPNRVRSLLEAWRPQVVLHAAAYKHVPMVEVNATEAARNNVLATASLARLCGERGVEAFVLISTDKAVHPGSVMGATKRLAELVIQDSARRYQATRYVAVRFGNVLGSSGSVVPIFREQIRKGGPVTVTHPEVERYFMTVSEAAQLVLEAAAIGRGGEILLLNMGEPVKILDLAEDMITLSGFRAYEEIPIVFIGLRPGEKLREQLEFSGEGVDRTRHPKIFVGRLEPCPGPVLERGLERLGELVREGDEQGVRMLLQRIIPEAELDAAAVDGGLRLAPAPEEAAT